ncbi:helix-turn-helix transcriptional regulator [Alkalihalobacterium elongatum]|uniref:helix-turn-helix transcriptional regulator n=1 Tax=Alkalihalobacterium elongatum TaxID=2675466 RepID=UPI002E2DB170|nr:WYL domain-containing protein [Alkalihalobacterium elongatum]
MGEVKTGLRLLLLKQIFLEHTDDHHQLSIKDLVGKLKMQLGPNENVEQKAVKRYIKTLQATGFEIIENVEKYGEIYYSHQDRLFENYQLRLLIDPILSARFITEDEKKHLVNNLKKLTSKYKAKSLPDPIVYHQSINSNYQLIKLHIDIIHTAIYEQKMINFQYGDFDFNKKFQLRHGGAIYQIEPHALIWESNFYYLIGEDIKYDEKGNPRNYRLDRMRNVTITDERFVKKTRDLSMYVQNSFHMFGGQDEWVMLEFKLDQSVLNGVIDKFGIQANIRLTDRETFILKAKAKISDGLKGWILTWGSKVKVLSPAVLVEEIEMEIENMIKNYS